MTTIESIALEQENDNKLTKVLNMSEEKVAHKIKKAIYYTTKKIFDIICALIGCLMLLPVSLITKISYLLTGDKEPIFFTQKRIGKNGEEFNFYKFRTMIPNADEELKRILKEDKELAKEYKENKKMKHDPRITKMGRFLRKSSLDELPQFINVLKGDMSVIGNRPYLPREKKDMGKYFNDIVSTKCGIVSYWAVMGRSDVSFKTRLKLEQYYSKNQSLKLDVKIFFRTFKVVLLKKGAK